MTPLKGMNIQIYNSFKIEHKQVPHVNRITCILCVKDCLQSKSCWLSIFSPPPSPPFYLWQWKHSSVCYLFSYICSICLYICFTYEWIYLKYWTLVFIQEILVTCLYARHTCHFSLNKYQTTYSLQTFQLYLFLK